MINGKKELPDNFPISTEKTNYDGKLKIYWSAGITENNKLIMPYKINKAMNFDYILRRKNFVVASNFMECISGLCKLADKADLDFYELNHFKDSNPECFI